MRSSGNCGRQRASCPRSRSPVRASRARPPPCAPSFPTTPGSCSKPKLHFLDTGLACYLLGIRSPEMLRDHPLRGAIFESFVVAELIKAYSNRGLDAPLYHWRDSSGLEIDVLLELADGPLPIEVKSGMTVPPQAVASLLRWSALSGREEPRGVLVHGGTESFTLRGCRVLPWTLS